MLSHAGIQLDAKLLQEHSQTIDVVLGGHSHVLTPLPTQHPDPVSSLSLEYGDLADEKLKIAQELGADLGVNPKNTDAVKAIQDATGGRGADIAMEVVGATATVKTAIESTRKGGSVTLVGNLAPEVNFPLQSVVTRELTVYGTCGSNGEYPECIDLLSRGVIQVEPLISAKATLEEGANWFDRLYAAEAGLMKVILQPGE